MSTRTALSLVKQYHTATYHVLVRHMSCGDVMCMYGFIHAHHRVVHMNVNQLNTEFHIKIIIFTCNTSPVLEKQLLH